MKAIELRKGMVIRLDGHNVLVTEVQMQTASSRSGNTLYKLRGRDIVTRQKVEASFKGDDPVQEVDFERRPVQFLYVDGEGLTFMDRDSYEQYTFDRVSLEAEQPYLTDGLEGLHALVADGVPLGIELPATVVLTIQDCAPALKGTSASARSKPATLSTGLMVQVPEYLEPGEEIRVNTVTGEFSGRA